MNYRSACYPIFTTSNHQGAELNPLSRARHTLPTPDYVQYSGSGIVLGSQVQSVGSQQIVRISGYSVYEDCFALGSPARGHMSEADRRGSEASMQCLESSMSGELCITLALNPDIKSMEDGMAYRTFHCYECEYETAFSDAQRK